MMRKLFVFLLLFAITPIAWAVSVTARLSHRVAEVGSEVRLEVEVSGANSQVDPPEITVEGLEIRYVGPSTSTQIQFMNGRVTRDVRTTHGYQVVPQREGNFTIPPLAVEVDGQTYRTQPVGLKVQKGGAGGGQAAEEQARYFAEIEVKKKEAYVGEVLPVEVRLLIDARVRVEDVTSMPDLTGDGFTMQKFPRFEQERETRDGRDYLVLVFRTAMTPTKAGKLTIGPCDIPFVAQVQRPRRSRGGRSLFDSIFGDDAFDPFGVFGERRRFSAKAPAIELDVKPLPSEGKPASFSGAVGNFTFEAQGSPSAVKIGEPVTMRLRVEGRGNFDRMEAPRLVDADGWQAYDASSDFAASNELNTSGTKIFEMPVVPERKHTQMPQFEFSYFDPDTGRYEIVHSKPAPLTVHGEPLVAATPAPSAPAQTASPSPAQAEEPAAQSPVDIAGLRYEEGARRNFEPIHRSIGFLLANGVAGLAALGLLGARFLRREPAKVRAAAFRRQRDELWRRIRSSEDSTGFYDDAVRLIQAEAALRGAAEPASVDAASARTICHLDDAMAAEIEQIFDARAERLYAGRAAVATSVSPAERERVLATLEKLQRA